MNTVALLLSVTALVAVVVLAFGYSALLRMVTELQNSSATRSLRPAATIEQFSGKRISLVLVVDQACNTCTERLEEFGALVKHIQDDRLDLHLVGPGTQINALPGSVSHHTDPAFMGSLGVGILPAGLVYDEHGREIRRSVLGDRQSLLTLFEWARAQATQTSNTEHLASREAT